MDNNVQLPDEYDQIVRPSFRFIVLRSPSLLRRIETSSPSEA